jgi:hypothetical protein
MSTIGGPGGIGGPRGPGGPDGPSQIDDLDDVASQAPIGEARGAPPAGNVSGTGGIEALAAEVAAGRLTPREAIDQLVEATAGPELDAAERAELRELLSDLVAHDPYLGGLMGRM